MARARNIKPGFFRNAELVELPVETRLLFIGLWTLADREGRLEDRPKQIKMELFPADSFDIGSMLVQLHEAGFVNRYEVDSRKFLEVVNFVKHQDPHYKEKASEIPPPPGKEDFFKATGVTRTTRQRILDRDGHACTSCGATEGLCIDHIHPVSRGGDSSDENLQVLCSPCNTKKGNKIGGESKNSKQRRINIDPNLIQRIDASPSDSLIPDSLIPDSKEHGAEAPRTKKPMPELPDWVPVEAWNGYAEMRTRIRKPMTARAMTLVLKELTNFLGAGHDIAAVLDKSTRNNWVDVYAPKPSDMGQKLQNAPNNRPQWVIDAGFSSVAEAHNERCYERNANEFRDGKRVEVQA